MLLVKQRINLFNNLPVQNLCEKAKQGNLQVGVSVRVESVVGLHHDVALSVALDAVLALTGRNVQS